MKKQQQYLFLTTKAKLLPLKNALSVSHSKQVSGPNFASYAALFGLPPLYTPPPPHKFSSCPLTSTLSSRPEKLALSLRNHFRVACFTASPQILFKMKENHSSSRRRAVVGNISSQIGTPSPCTVMKCFINGRCGGSDCWLIQQLLRHLTSPCIHLFRNPAPALTAAPTCLSSLIGH